MMAILLGLKEVALSMVASLLTKAVMRPLILKFLKGEAAAYAARAAKTEDKADDARAQACVDAVSSLETTWEK